MRAPLPTAAVQTDGTRVDTFASDRVADERLIIYHYITKSQEASRQGVVQCIGRGWCSALEQPWLWPSGLQS